MLARQLRAENVRSHRRRIIDKGSLYRILRKRVYVGQAVHKGVAYPGEHAPIISQVLWNKARSVLRESPSVRACRSRASTPALLKGLLFGPTGRAMSPTHTRRGGKLYRKEGNSAGSCGSPISRPKGTWPAHGCGPGDLCVADPRVP